MWCKCYIEANLKLYVEITALILYQRGDYNSPSSMSRGDIEIRNLVLVLS